MPTYKKVFLIALPSSCVILAILVMLFPTFDWKGLASFCAFLLICLLSFILYIVPAIIAVGRKHRQVGPIIIINLFFGWTFLGWVIAFAWSLSSVPTPKTS